jgi:hypothetical protein
MADDQVLIEVVWENQVKAQARLRVQPFATLRDMHNALVTAKPTFDSKDYCYMFEGRPIFREFWDIFEAHCFNKKLYMRPGAYSIKNIEGTAIIPVPVKPKNPTSRATMNNGAAVAPLAAKPSPASVAASPAPTPAPAPKKEPVAPAARPQATPSVTSSAPAISEPAKPRTGTQIKPSPALRPAAPAATPAPAVAEPPKPSASKPKAATPTSPAAAATPASQSEQPLRAAPAKAAAATPAPAPARPPVAASPTPAAVPAPAPSEPSTDGGDDDVIPTSPTANKSVKRVEALYGYKARSVDQLTFHKGDIMEILIYRPKGKWWFAKLGDKKGWVPHNFVRSVDDGAASPSSNKASPDVPPSVEVDVEVEDITGSMPSQKSKLGGKR